jgi:hypothetical protein
MTNVVSFERETTPQFDTAVRSLSTLRKPVRDNNEGTESRTILVDIQQAVRTASEVGLHRVASPDASLAFQPRFLLSLMVYLSEPVPRGASFRSRAQAVPAGESFSHPGWHLLRALPTIGAVFAA